MKLYERRGGFTVVELLVVIVVIGILAGLISVAYRGAQERAHTAALVSDLKNVADQLLIDESKTGHFPATIDEANGGEGVALSPGTALQYTPDNEATPPTFCVTGTNTTVVYKVTEANEPVEGVCTGHTGTPGDDEDPGEETPQLPPSLIASYGFNEASGSTFANQVPGGVSASLWPSAQIVAGNTGNAVVGNSGSQAAVVSGSPALSTQGWTALTVEFWFYRTNTNAYDVLTFWNNSSRGNDWGGVYLNSTTGYGVWLYTSGGNWPGTSVTTPMGTGVWRHIAYTWSAASGKLKLYADGQLLKTVNAAGASLAQNTAILDIGGTDAYGGTQRAGRIDDLRIYNTELLSEEIVTDMNTPVTP